MRGTCSKAGLEEHTVPHGTRLKRRPGDSFPVPNYLLFKDDEGLRRNEVTVTIVRYDGKDAKKVAPRKKVQTSFYAMRSHQILLESDWERVCLASPRGQVQNLSCENDFFYYHANKTNFHKKGFSLGLVLRVRDFGTRKWPNRSLCVH